MAEIIRFFALLCMVPLYVLFYFMSKNTAEYETAEYLTTLFYVVAVSGVSVCLCSFILRFSKKIALALSGICFCTILSLVLDITLLEGKWVISIPVSIVCFSFIFFLSKKKLLKPVFVILALMSLFSIGQYVYEIREDYTEKYAKLKSLGKMEKKPNIYLIVLEAYTGVECLEKRYGYDNKEFYDFLEKNGFKNYKNVYTTRPNTRSSLFTVMTMSNPRRMREKRIRHLFRRQYPSIVLDTLEKNGYHFNFVFPNRYLGTVGNTERADTFLAPSLTLFKKYQKEEEVRYSKFQDYFMALQNDYEKASFKEPAFFLFKIGGAEFDYTGGVNHLLARYWRKDKIEIIPKLKKDYIEEMKKENKQLQKFVEKIIKKDKDAVIILMGDHGPLLYNTWKKNYDYAHYGVSKEDFILDQFNVHLSIRTPQSVKLSNPKKKYYLFELFQDVFDALIPTYKKKEARPYLYNFNNEPVK